MRKTGRLRPRSAGDRSTPSARAPRPHRPPGARRPDDHALLSLQGAAGNRATRALVTQRSGPAIQRGLLSDLRDGIVSGLRSIIAYFTKSNQAEEQAVDEEQPATSEAEVVPSEVGDTPVVEQQQPSVDVGESSQPSEPSTEAPKPGKGKQMWANLAGDWQRMQGGEKTQTKVGATFARRMGGRSDDLWDQLQGIKKNGELFPGQQRAVERELAKAQARSQKFQKLIGGPETFMLKGEIQDHLGSFKEGAHAFITPWHHKNFKGDWGGWGRAGDRNFVAPLPAADSAVDKAKNGEGIRTLEDELGIPKWDWVKNCPDKSIYRYIIPPDKLEEAGLEMARGVEGGAYAKEWVAGGLTLGGLQEAVVKTFQGKDFELAEQTGIVKIEELKLPSTPDLPQKD